MMNLNLYLIIYNSQLNIQIFFLAMYQACIMMKSLNCYDVYNNVLE